MIGNVRNLIPGAALAAALAAAPAAGPAFAATASHQTVARPHGAVTAPAQHEWYGTVRDVKGLRFDMVLRNGHVLLVDNSVPTAAHHALFIFAGRPVIVQGSLGADNVVHAQVVLRSHTMSQYWPADH